MPPPLRWWGWGDTAMEIPRGLELLLRNELGIDGVELRHAVDESAVSMPPSGLAHDVLRSELESVCGREHVVVSPAARLRHAAGRSYSDLLRLRSGRLETAPDAVVYPATDSEVAAVLRACAASDCAVVPFGGGTSVVGGVTPLRGAHRAVISLSTRRLDRLIAVDRRSLTATLQAGMTGPQVESSLAAGGLTLGHAPQSFEYATVGGFAATRSAGQASSGWGRFDEMVLGLRCVTPSGDLVVHPHPASAAGPSMRELVVGSEGTVGVITEVTARVHRCAGSARYEAWSFTRFHDGVAALRACAQAQVAPDVARLSDQLETRVGVAISAHGGPLQQLARRYLDLRGHTHGCVLITGWERASAARWSRRDAARRLIRRHGGITLGRSPGQAWRKGRFAAPYLRDQLLDRGVLVETLETATAWSNLERLHDSVTAALTNALSPSGAAPLVGAHVSHLYESGASLYFTVLARAQEPAGEQWATAKQAACEAILCGGGTITHHHAVGVDHLPYLRREIGDQGVAALQAFKARLDPSAIMNPGKLLPG